MIFWIVAVAMAALCAAVLVRALSRGAAGREAAEADLSVYRDQLAEVERDLARGTILPEEAERLRTEISRRILAADRARAEGPGRGQARVSLAAVLSVIVATGLSFAAYSWLGAPGYPDLPVAGRIARAEAERAARPGQAEHVATLPPHEDVLPEDPDQAGLIRRLREAVAERPDDLQGQTLLAQNEAALGNHGRAAAAQERIVALKGAQAAAAADYAALAFYLFSEARGYVSPEAEAAARAVLDRDPENAFALYLMGELNIQVGRPDLAFAQWRQVIEGSPDDAPWLPRVRQLIVPLAAAAGVEYAPPTTAGPTEDDIAAAGDLSPEDRAAMIGQMVEGLAARLANEGGSGAEWAQLIRALGVMGDTDQAREVWAEAQDLFAASPSELETVAAAAREAGVLE